jgi:hypothetical protein
MIFEWMKFDIYWEYAEFVMCFPSICTMHIEIICRTKLYFNWEWNESLYWGEAEWKLTFTENMRNLKCFFRALNNSYTDIMHNETVYFLRICGMRANTEEKRNEIWHLQRICGLRAYTEDKQNEIWHLQRICGICNVFSEHWYNLYTDNMQNNTDMNWAYVEWEHTLRRSGVKFDIYWENADWELILRRSGMKYIYWEYEEFVRCFWALVQFVNR